MGAYTPSGRILLPVVVMWFVCNVRLPSTSQVLRPSERWLTFCKGTELFILFRISNGNKNLFETKIRPLSVNTIHSTVSNCVPHSPSRYDDDDGFVRFVVETTINPTKGGSEAL